MERLLKATILTGVLLAPLAACGGGDGGGDAEGAAADHAQPEVAEDENAANEPVDPGDDPQSTFAVDIDTASYDFARRSINDGDLPPQDMVRPEEFVNYFDQDYSEPDGSGFSVSVDGAELPEWYSAGDADHVMRVGLQTRTESDAARRDVNLTFVIDVSGSMSGDRIQIVQDSLHMLVDELRPTDAVAIVTYQSDSAVLKDMTQVGDGEELHAAVDDLHAGGSTNMHAGLVDGYEIAAGAYEQDNDNRVILLSDGQANVGLTEHDDILEDLDDPIAEGVTLLTVGVGDSYNQRTLEQLADNGDGWAVYFATATEAERVFSERLTSTLGVAARDAKIQVTFAEATVAEYRLIGFENRALEDDEFEDDSVDGGEVGPGHSVTALYALTLTGDAGDLATAEVRWLDPDTEEPDTAESAIGTGDLTSVADAAPALGVDLTAAAFAEVLRGSADGFDCETLLPVADDFASRTEDPDVGELAELIALASDLGA
ncbi:vWA domain-containing protein [Glycomyces xiaoerkulensis]|uniref:vWA domain-containing protein n=1 Tax=Glycomyces xiaoerkulensis TaxID=2038139 RepID=UPI0018E3FB16|nr:von Willebrand factor type A domain-containing protein [Glycomyces xiaoerkulensis]